jgi:hypothetical protein
MGGVNHGVRGPSWSGDENICLVRVDCQCGNSNLTDRSGGNVATWHKVRVGPVGGRVRVFCNNCQIEYLIKAVDSEREIEVDEVPKEQVDGQVGEDAIEEEPEEFSGLFPSDLFPEDPAINAYLDQLFGGVPVNPAKENNELQVKLERAVDVVHVAQVSRGLSDLSPEAFSRLVVAVFAKMK